MKHHPSVVQLLWAIKDASTAVIACPTLLLADTVLVDMTRPCADPVLETRAILQQNALQVGVLVGKVLRYIGCKVRDSKDSLLGC